jgi:hypothetical protein
VPISKDTELVTFSCVVKDKKEYDVSTDVAVKVVVIV